MSGLFALLAHGHEVRHVQQLAERNLADHTASPGTRKHPGEYPSPANPPYGQDNHDHARPRLPKMVSNEAKV